ncbi:hypothetical protein BLOT_003094 [Blomia tropicalis]|nr:hypothetical protein BLOT_003094 [Blomia tropicalis]
MIVLLAHHHPISSKWLEGVNEYKHNMTVTDNCLNKYEKYCTKCNTILMEDKSITLPYCSNDDYDYDAGIMDEEQEKQE